MTSSPTGITKRSRPAWANSTGWIIWRPRSRSDRSTLIAYMPTAREVTVDLSKISGTRADAWWLDPQTGTSSPAGNFETLGPRLFTPPDSGDWILVVDDASRNRPAPGAAGP